MEKRLKKKEVATSEEQTIEQNNGKNFNKFYSNPVMSILLHQSQNFYSIFFLLLFIFFKVYIEH